MFIAQQIFKIWETDLRALSFLARYHFLLSLAQHLCIQ